MKTKGFTLIELLIVVAIIGILAAIAIPNFLNAQVRAKVAEAKSEMRTIGTALEAYRIDGSDYPTYLSVALEPLGYLDRLVPLTSPVSHLKSLPEDPFAQVYSETWGGYRSPTCCDNCAFPNPNPWTYEFINYRRCYDVRGGWQSAEIESMLSVVSDNFSSVQWSLSSMGPKSFNTKAYEPPYIITLYDPTNGTTSEGGIYLFGPGHGFTS